jgi:hypothetical protein
MTHEVFRVSNSPYREPYWTRPKRVMRPLCLCGHRWYMHRSFTEAGLFTSHGGTCYECPCRRWVDGRPSAESLREPSA